MITWGEMVYGAALSAVLAVFVVVVVARQRRWLVIVAVAAGAFAGPVAWNAILHRTGAHQFFVDAPIRVFPIICETGWLVCHGGEPEGITDLAVTAVPQATDIDATAQVTPKVGQSPGCGRRGGRRDGSASGWRSVRWSSWWRWPSARRPG
jgi:hypothetical protein